MENFALIDSTSVITTQELLSGERNLNAINLFDLATLCEGIVLYDRLYTLLGQSYGYIYNIWIDSWDEQENRRPSADSSLSSMGSFCDYLRSEHLLIPINAYEHSYHGWRLHEGEDAYRIKKIYESVDRQALISQFSQVFDINQTPWGPVFVDDITSLTSETTNAFGHGGMDDIEKATPSQNYGLDEFIAQTLRYIEASLRTDHPYLSTALRSPIVSATAFHLETQTFSVIEKVKDMISANQRKRLKELHAFYDGINETVYDVPPVLALILNKVEKPSEIIPMAMEMRYAHGPIAFRIWNRRIQEAIITATPQSLNYLQEAKQALVEAVNTTKAEFSFKKTVRAGIKLLPKLILTPADTTAEILEKGVDNILKRLAEPQLLFVRELRDAVINLNEQQIERVFGKKLSEKDITLLATIAGK